MSEAVEEIIAALRQRLGAANDADLARKLGVDKSTVSSWKARGSVPARFHGILRGERQHQSISTPPAAWAPHERAAFEIALFRFVRATAEKATHETYREAIETFTNVGGRFWLLMQRSLNDVVSRQNAGDYPLHTAVGLVIFDDFELGDRALQRDQALLVSGIA